MAKKLCGKTVYLINFEQRGSRRQNKKAAAEKQKKMILIIDGRQNQNTKEK